ncbi:MAG: YdcF family protein, partial [Candidatus Puniceispirillales bacterium]
MPIIWCMLIIIIFKINNIYVYFKAILILLLLLSLPIIIELFKYPLTNGSSKYIAGDHISAVIVLTAGSYKDVNEKWYPSATSIKRTVLANNIAKKAKVPLIILGGNQIGKFPSESLLVSKFVHNNNLLLDTQSKNTYQSVKNLEKNLLAINLNKNNNYLVVTSDIHNLRTALTFKSQGYKIKIFNYNS